MSYLITAPHSLCNSEIKVRHCDRLSQAATADLTTSLRAEGAKVLTH